MPSRLAPIARSAEFLAILAYPENAVSRDAFAGAMLCKLFDDGRPWDGEVDCESVRLASLMQDRKRVETAIQNGSRIINEQRIEAAFQAWPQWIELLRRAGEREPIDSVPTLAGEAMIKALSAHIIEKRARRRGVRRSGDGAVGTANILDRHWKRSLPVLHMALALYSFIDGEGIYIGAILYDGQKRQAITLYAAYFRDAVGALFKIKRQFPAIAPIFQK
jgi:hypothetical protein